MSDGPHRSLPLRRHWRDLAERSAKLAFSPQEVAEALPYALKMEMREVRLLEIQNILGGGPQASLFGDDRLEQLELARSSSAGSAIGGVIIDCAIEAVSAGKAGYDACEDALTAALDEYARGTARSTEEHYQRSDASQRMVDNVRTRLCLARQACDFRAVARDLLSGVRPTRAAMALPKHSGLDEGPRL